MHPETRTTIRTIPSLPTPVLKGLNERQNSIVEMVIKIISYFEEDCSIEIRQLPKPKKIEHKKMLVIGSMEITIQTTTYDPSRVVHREFKIVYAQRISFQLIYDGSDKTHVTKAIVDQSADIEMLLKKIIHNQEDV